MQFSYFRNMLLTRPEINDDPHHDDEVKNVAEIMKLICLAKVHS